VAVRQAFVVDEDFGLGPMVDEVEKFEELFDFVGRVGRLMGDEFAFSFGLVCRASPGQADRFFVVGTRMVGKDESDFEGLGLVIGMENLLELFFLGFFVRHGAIFIFQANVLVK